MIQPGVGGGPVAGGPAAGGAVVGGPAAGGPVAGGPVAGGPGAGLVLPPAAVLSLVAPVNPVPVSPTHSSLGAERRAPVPPRS
ncbi:hypothetical protein [Kutzneria kofuensis]|uniref:hypothetical protein n=1 Tax=Kutzneria kofuensis TaxID=103725 RepID=UPI0031EA394F